MYIFLINCKIVIYKILSEREINVQFRYFLTDKRASRCILWKQASITGRRRSTIELYVCETLFLFAKVRQYWAYIYENFIQVE